MHVGADWSEGTADPAHDVLAAALASGVPFFDPADGYVYGRSEQLLGAMRSRLDSDAAGGEATPSLPFIATKVSRRADPFAPESFTEENLRGWVERSRRNLAMGTLDLVQLHCPPPEIGRASCRERWSV